MVSSNHDEDIAECLVEIYEKVGLKGAVSIQDGDGVSRKTRVDFVSGLSIDQGFLSPYFADDRTLINEEGRTIYVALVDGNVEREQDVVKMLEFAKKTYAPLLIFASEFASEALTTLVVNRLQLGLKVCAIKLPMFQSEDILEDLASFTGSEIVGD